MAEKQANFTRQRSGRGSELIQAVGTAQNEVPLPEMVDLWGKVMKGGSR